VLKINFTDFWRGFDKADNYFWHLLSKRFTLELSEEPDFLIYSSYGKAHRKYTCVRIFYASENVRPDFLECDFAFTFDYGITPRHYRLPLYVLYDDLSKLVAVKDVDTLARSKTKFCNFLFSNPGAKERIEFFNTLSRYQKVDSGGKVLNNIGMEVKDKLTFIQDYKFTIAFENSSYPGYTTEKIIHPMLVNSIPVYWGNPRVENDFNTKSFINVHDYNSFDEVVARIVEIDNNELLYKQYLKEPYFKNNVVPLPLTEGEILNRFEEIFNFKMDTSGTLRLLEQRVAFIRKDIRTYAQLARRKFVNQFGVK